MWGVVGNWDTGRDYGSRNAGFRADPFGGGSPALASFEQSMRRALAPHRGAMRAAEASRDPYERLNGALQIASAAAAVMGVPMSPVQMIRGGNAYADGRRILFGAELAATLPVKTLAQILLHEAGHNHAGHANPATDFVVRLLLQGGVISERDYARHNHQMEFVADAYAAVGA